MRRGALIALRVIGNDLAGRAARDAPIEEGTLRASSDVELDEGALEVTVAFNTVYAAYQHERTDLHHPLGGKAKYLEANLAEMAPRYEAALAAAIAREMR